MATKATELPASPALVSRTLTSITVSIKAPEDGGELLMQKGTLPKVVGYVVEYSVAGRLIYGAWTAIERASKEAVTVTVEGAEHSLPLNVHQGTTVTLSGLPAAADTAYAFRATSVTLKAGAAGGAGATLPTAEVILGKTSKPSEPIRCATALEEVNRLEALLKKKEEEVQNLSFCSAATESQLNAARKVIAELQAAENTSRLLPSKITKASKADLKRVKAEADESAKGEIEKARAEAAQAKEEAAEARADAANAREEVASFKRRMEEAVKALC